MTRSLPLLAVAILLTLPLSGCLYISTSGSFGPRLDPAVIARIIPGKTTKLEVLQWLGPPEEFLRSEVLESLADDTTRVTGAIALGNRAQDAFTWQHDRLEGHGIVLLLYNRYEAEVESDLLLVLFDEEDRVREVSFRPAGSRR